MINKILKKLLLLTMAFTTFISLFGGIGIKAAGVTVTAGSLTGYSVNVSNPDGHSEWNANYSTILIDGETGFCIQPGYILSEGGGFTPTPYVQYQLSIIVYEGWVTSDKTMEDYLATQFMIWESLGGTIVSTSFSSYSSYKANIQNKINHHNDVPSFPVGPLEVNIGEQLRIKDSNNVLNKFHIVSSDGLTASINGNELVIVGTLGALDNSKIVLEKFESKYIGTSLAYTKPGSQTVAKLMLWDPLSVNITIQVNKFGSLSITKRDDLGNNVPNTSFKLSKNADMSGPIGTYTTGANGIVIVDQLLPATYYAQEVSVPGHLILDSTIRSIEVKPNETSYFTANNNWKRGYIQVVKKDKDTGKTVVKANTTFSIYKIDGTYVQDITTNNNGTAKTGLLLYGDYYLLEKTAPDGYIITNDKLVYTITEDGKTYSQEISNKRVTGTISIKKEDSVTGSVPQGDATLEGAVYELKARTLILDPADGSVKYAKDSVVATLTTDKDAKALKSDLYLGGYYLKEKSPSYGYTLDPTEYDVTLSYANQNTSVITKSQTVKEKVIDGDFKITKVIEVDPNNSEITKPEKDAEFVVVLKKYVDKYGSVEEAYKHKSEFADKEYDLLITNKDGEDTSKKLAYGTYLAQQTKVGDENVDLLKEPFEVKIENENQPTIKYVISNQKFLSYLQLEKKDAETGKTVTLSNTSFKVYDVDNDKYLSQRVGLIRHDTWTTDETGKVTLPLKVPAGRYRLEEIKAPDGYLLNTDKIDFVMKESNVSIVDDENEPIQIVSFSDSKPIGSTKLIKRDKESGETLSGVQYQLTVAKDILDPADGSVVYKKGSPVSMDISEDGYYITNELGEIEVEGLPLGSYAWNETKALDGYVKDETTYIFELTQENDTQEIYVHEQTLENQKTKIEVIKEDVNNNALENAHLRLVDEDGNIVKQWVSKKSSMKLEGLLVGKEYTLYEDEAPKGYVIARPVTFTVDNTTRVQEIKMFDKQVGVSKLDEERKHLLGAKLQVVSAKTKDIVDEWESDGKEHMVSGLIEGNRYVLKEVEPPLGYEKEKDIEFMVNEDKEIQKLEMVDVLIREKIYIKKIDGDTKESIRMKSFEFTSYKDEGCTQKLRSIEADQEYGVVELELRYGEYWMKESKAPKGYQMSKDVLHIKVDENGVFVNGEKLLKEGDSYEISFENFKEIQPVVKTGDVHNNLQMVSFVMALGVSFYGILLSLKRLRKDIRLG